MQFNESLALTKTDREKYLFVDVISKRSQMFLI